MSHARANLVSLCCLASMCASGIVQASGDGSLGSAPPGRTEPGPTPTTIADLTRGEAQILRLKQALEIARLEAEIAKRRKELAEARRTPVPVMPPVAIATGGVKPPTPAPKPASTRADKTMDAMERLEREAAVEREMARLPAVRTIEGAGDKPKLRAMLVYPDNSVALVTKGDRLKYGYTVAEVGVEGVVIRKGKRRIPLVFAGVPTGRMRERDTGLTGAGGIGGGAGPGGAGRRSPIVLPPLGL